MGRVEIIVAEAMSRSSWRRRAAPSEQPACA